MKTTSAIPPVEHHPNTIVGIAVRFGQIAFGFAVVAAVLFLAAGRRDWLWAWVYLGIMLVSVLITGAIMLRRSPETVAERGQPGEMADWDRLVSGLWAATQYLVLPLVAGLDVRLGWAPQLSAAWHLAGALIVILGLALSSWAMITNAFFSTVVRIQRERGQTVCRSGPYRFVRHPGYAGFATLSLGIPLLLGSWWALIPGAVAVALMVARTVYEDRLLQAELPGYQAYVRDVRYRLVPGVW
jgi:protein-S-isoprenylcysteine O-methyltransferase Ste14